MHNAHKAKRPKMMILSEVTPQRRALTLKYYNKMDELTMAINHQKR